MRHQISTVAIKLRNYPLRIQTYPSLLDELAPSLNWVAKLGVAFALIALTALMAKTRFFLPDSPVPITLQTLGVIMAGGILGWRWAIVYALGYYLIGLAGVPLFAGADAGLAYVRGASGGYLLGFVLSAGLAGLFSQLGMCRWNTIWAMLFASAAVYIPGLIWLSFYVEPENLLTAGLYPFLIGDSLKVLVSGVGFGVLWYIADKLKARRNRSRQESNV